MGKREGRKERKKERRRREEEGIEPVSFACAVQSGEGAGN